MRKASNGKNPSKINESGKKPGKGSILVVDDEEQILKFLKRLLGGEGYICNVAENAEAANLFLVKNNVDLVISDIRMPGKSGIQLLEEIRKEYPDVATLMMTGYSDPQVAEKAISLGAYEYMYKPLQKRQVLTSVSNALRRRALDLQTVFEMENLELIIDEHSRNLSEANAKLNNALEGIVNAMSHAIEYRDPYTAGHQQRVARVAEEMAKMMGYTDKEISNIRMAGMIHDLGKISVPAEILSKPGKLTEAEFSIIKDHPTTGFNILKEIEFSYPLAEVIYQHHERLDGSGYPLKLSGEQIHQDAKILAVADVVEAMISHRPYRPALGLEIALGEIKKNKGRLYDPAIVDVCCRLFENSDFKICLSASLQ